MRASVFLFLLFLAGCGGDGQAPRHPVRGRVLFDGKPVPHALVVLHPLGASTGDAARPHAQVGPDGSFVVGTNDKADGAPAGEYAVTVEWLLSKGDDAPATNRLPARYARPSSSGLRATVRPGDNEIPPIQLKR